MSVPYLADLFTNIQSRVEDGIAKLDTIIAARDTQISSLSNQLSQVTRDYNDNLAILFKTQLELSDAKHEIERLKALIPPVDPPPPPTPPIEVSPDITITLGTQSFRPSLSGDRQGNETRYRGTLNPEVDVIIDIKDDGQIAVCLERCWADLPVTALVIESTLTVEIGKETYYGNPIRLHHHTRPRSIINPSLPPSADLPALISANLIPNYDTSISIPEDTLQRIDEGRYPYELWSNKYSTDPITEQYGQIISSWVGGAAAWGNEASHLAPIQLIYLLTQDPRAWDQVVALANSSGNYAIHHKLRDSAIGGRFPLAHETGSLPFLQGPESVSIRSQSGKQLPIPEPAHEHSLTYIAYLLTGERWYREELEAWSRYNLLTRPRTDLRTLGIVWSGQIRAATWSLRALLHTVLATAGGSGDHESYRAELIANLVWMNETFANSSAPEHLSTGVCAIHSFRSAPLLNYVTLLPRPRYFATWNHHVLASVLNECVRAGFVEALPMLNHVTKVVAGQWLYGLSPYHIGWGNHAYDLDSWFDIIRTTFAGATLTDPPRNAFPTITTPDYVAWARSAVVAAVDSGQSWAHEALAWIDSEAAKYKGGIPLAWKINPI